MRKFLSKNNGITLIALIVTIIVLLILAGVAIATLFGENGILEKARLAKEKNDQAISDENERLENYEDNIDEIISGNRNISEQRIREIIQEELQNVSSYPNGTPVVIDTWNANATSWAEKTITAPGDGWIEEEGTSDGTTGWRGLDLCVGNLKSFDVITGSSHNIYKSLPCKQGVTISYRIWGAVTSGKLTFIPMVDSAE